jgi:hypothetical protein
MREETYRGQPITLFTYHAATIDAQVQFHSHPTQSAWVVRYKGVGHALVLELIEVFCRAMASHEHRDLREGIKVLKI